MAESRAASWSVRPSLKPKIDLGLLRMTFLVWTLALSVDPAASRSCKEAHAEDINFCLAPRGRMQFGDESFIAICFLDSLDFLPEMQTNIAVSSCFSVNSRQQNDTPLLLAIRTHCILKPEAFIITRAICGAECWGARVSAEPQKGCDDKWRWLRLSCFWTKPFGVCPVLPSSARALSLL